LFKLAFDFIPGTFELEFVHIRLFGGWGNFGCII